MNTALIIKKTARYAVCAVKYAAALICAPFVKNKEKYRALWLIAERGVDARDNGYYFFKYVTQKHPEINIAYVISKSSPDADRVRELGRTIPYGSFSHFISLAASEVKISSHIMGYTPYIDFFVRADRMGLVKGKKIFLQHGIIKDNLTFLYADNVSTDLFVCSAKPEYEYVRDNYGYKDGVVRLLGLCRYDDLYKIEKPSKKILIMPTWRYDLRKADKKQFEESEYFKTFSHLLKSEEFNAILEEYDYEALFYPHMELQKFIDSFKGTGRVKIIHFRDSTVQSLLINSDVLITDFSSVFFDYAYMEKPMMFYQFDEASFRKNHYGEGYFDYNRDAFGDVVQTEEALLSGLRKILSNKAAVEDKYMDRINSFFTLRDKDNSKRNFDAIKEIVG